MRKPWFERNPSALERLKQELREHFPSLHAFSDGKVVTVRGTYPVVVEGQVADRYSLKIWLPDEYPRNLPIVQETAGRIPHTLDRHVFPRAGALCLGVREELWITLKGDFSVRRLLDGPVRTYLIGNSLFEETGRWPYGERSHDSEGVLEFYAHYLGISDPTRVAAFLRAVARGNVLGHWNCPCGSGKIVRKCHRDAVFALQMIPPKALLGSAEALDGSGDQPKAA